MCALIGIAGFEKFVELMIKAGAKNTSNKIVGLTPSFLATFNGK